MFKRFLLLPCFCFLTTGIIANNKLLQENNYRLPQGITSEDYQHGKIIFKVKDQYRSLCTSSGVNIQPLNLVLNNAKCTSVGKVFAGKEKPLKEKNAMGQQLADLSLIYVAEIDASLQEEKVINAMMATGTLLYNLRLFIKQVLHLMILRQIHNNGSSIKYRLTAHGIFNRETPL